MLKANTNKAIEFLLARGNLPILYWLKKDILEVPVDRERKNLQKFAKRIRILEMQKSNGGWCNKKFNAHPRWENTYYIVDTLRNLFLLYNYGCEWDNEEIQKAVKFLQSTQTGEGDFRGAYLNEYAPTYHALTLEILALLGVDDEKTKKGFQWIIKTRQDDGGWVIPYRTIDKEQLKNRYNVQAQLKLSPVKPNRSHPFSHLVTGMVLRALVESQHWKKSKEARKAGELLMDRFFKEDKYEDRRHAHYWKEITYPFWATDILSSLDSLSKLGFDIENKQIQLSLRWLINRQTPQGYWPSGLKKSALEEHLWITLAVLKVLKNFKLLKV